MKQLFNRRVVAVALLILLSTLAIASWAKSRSNNDVLVDLETFTKVIEKVQSYYVDEVDTHEIITKAIESLLKDLDPHSQFLTGLDYEDLMLSTQGQFGGLGIFISFRDNYPTVISPIEGTPADRAGLQGGDRIVEIEGEPSEGWHVTKAVRFLRGEPGTTVRFKVSRPGGDEPIEYSLVREEIKVKSVSYQGMFDDIGYVKLSSFSKNTRRELVDALEELEAAPMKGLVLDLRSNPGGLLQAATGVSELFLEKDRLVVYTKGRYSRNNHKYYSGKSHKHHGYPIIVMVNGASASASEIVAGALQDWDAGFLVGQTTFGKGTVQTVFSLSDSQAVKLTTAKYYTPSGRSIHKDHRKVDSDNVTAVVEGSNSESEDVVAITQTDGSEVEDIRIFHTSGGRKVFGGGGIKPDLEFEPQEYGDLERGLERDALFFTFAIRYSMTHEPDENFEVTDEILAQFKTLLKEREFEFTEEDFSGTSLDYVKKAIKRELASKDFGRKAMYRVVLENDPEFQRVLELFEEAPTLQAMFDYVEEQRGLKKASLD
ncbi:MAG: S41 family peptidase [bacterium]|nr:S41 family peptidase [bacterium]